MALFVSSTGLGLAGGGLLVNASSTIHSSKAKYVSCVSNNKAVLMRVENSSHDEPANSVVKTLKSKVAQFAAIATIASIALFDPTHDNVALAAKGDGGVTFANASGFVVNKDPESLLRWALPIENKALRKAQEALEQVTYDMRKLAFGKAAEAVNRAEGIILNQSKDILSKFPADRVDSAKTILDDIKSSFSAFREPLAEKRSEDIILVQRSILRKIGDLEQLQVDKFPFEVPAEYQNLPQLKGRASVEIVVKKAEDKKFDIEGNLFDQGVMKVVIDGYSAPVTAGNFVDLVNRGFYNNMTIMRSDGFVIQTGDPDGPADGFVDPDTKQVRTIPLEVFPKEDKVPVYGDTLEDLGRGSAPTKLPFQAYGTLAMAREEFAPDSASSQFFWFLFEPDLTPAGRNLLDGRYTVFGYTVDGEKFLRDLKEGDRIVSAKVIQGVENLQQPSK